MLSEIISSMFTIKMLSGIYIQDSEFEELSYEDYHRLVNDIDTSQYQLCVDSRKMDNPSKNVNILDIVRMYVDSHYKKISCIVTSEQIAFVAQTKRLFSEAGIKNVEIIYK